MRKFFTWVSNNWYVILCIALLLFIEFYPKIPLADILPGYIVRVRLEDFFVAFMVLVFGVLWWKKNVTLETPMTKILIAYVIVNILSMLSAVFIVRSVPLELLHVGKMFLHFARRLEYFSIFFLFYNAAVSFRQVKMIMIALLIMILGVSLFGFGQKYLYWPVYSTMNREFSKGMRLVLTDHARVPSTFGGHYDMSAFMMFSLLLTLSLLFFSKNSKEKIALTLVFVTGFWLLILGSSRSSFLGYLLGAGILILLIGVYKRSWKWILSRGFLVFLFSLTVMVMLGDLSSRFSQLGIIKQANSYLSALQKPVVKQPENSIKVEPVTETDQLPVPVKTVAPTTTPRELPPDVYKEIPDKKVIIATEGGKTVTKVIEVPREFSECTFTYGLSACIRFDTLWPRAINGFLRNPLVGSGPSTLTKAIRAEFTEAESTDNDFLRTLGEVGILGAITFYGGIFLFLSRALRVLTTKQRNLSVALLCGVIAGTFGMLFNALYIDVFEASKVAFFFWAMMGVGFRVIELNRKTQMTQRTSKSEGLKNPVI